MVSLSLEKVMKNPWTGRLITTLEFGYSFPCLPRAVFFGLWFIDCSGQSSTFMCLLALDVLSET